MCHSQTCPYKREQCIKPRILPQFQGTVVSSLKRQSRGGEWKQGTE